MTGIADTGFLVAFLNRADNHHKWAVELSRQVTEPLLTCEAVLAETAFHVQNAQLTLDLVRNGLARIAFSLDSEITRLGQLAKRYSDRSPDLADLCVIRMSELHPKHSVITVDAQDFKVYRRNGREVIPLILPPGLSTY